MSPTKILIGLFSLAVVVIMVGNLSVRKDPLAPLTTASATLVNSNISMTLNRLLNSNGYRSGYTMELNTEAEPATFTATNGKTFVLAKGRRCTKMAPFA